MLRAICLTLMLSCFLAVVFDEHQAKGNDNANFGPGRDLPLDLDKTYEIKVPKGMTAKIRVSVFSDEKVNYENCFILYRKDSHDIKEIMVCGNYTRKGMSKEKTISDHDEETVYYVTGWHKNGKPNEHSPWEQSRKVKEDDKRKKDDKGQVLEATYQVSFPDNPDQDCDAIHATVIAGKD